MARYKKSVIDKVYPTKMDLDKLIRNTDLDAGFTKDKMKKKRLKEFLAFLKQVERDRS